MEMKELMIGDWVYRPDCYDQVKEIRHNGVICIDSIRGLIIFSELEPIPLTPEILEKNGFALRPDGWLWCEEEGNEEQNYIFIQFRKGCDEVRLVELYFVNNALTKFRKIQFVHELQHALKLCGIKKEIEL